MTTTPQQLASIELLEKKYLNKYFHFLKFVEDDLLLGFKTKEKIKDDWYGLYKSGISDFSVGAERVLYSLLNGKGVGQPNSAPVGADLFFEVEDAYIHIDLKTVGATLNPRDKHHEDGAWSNNIGDYSRYIFVGTNQNSYRSEITKANGDPFDPKRIYKPSLPTYYNKGKSDQKICLSYFVTILYDKDSLDTLIISIMCMPNGELVSHYKTKPLSAGKNLDKTRFSFSATPDFELLDGKPKRVRVVYLNDSMNEEYSNKLQFYRDVYKKQIN